MPESLIEIVFRFLFTVVEWCMVAIHTKGVKHMMLCVTGVYLRDIISTFFLNQFCT